MKVYKITGKVVRSDTKEGISGLRVEAWDKDLLVNDLVGSAITTESGMFRIQFDETYFKELFFDRRPDLFFKIFKGSRLIKSTEDSVLWNVDQEDIEQTIEVKEGNDMSMTQSKPMRVKQRGSEIFKFVTIRPFQRQGEVEIENKKVLCYDKETISEFHQILLEAKENPPEGSSPREAMLNVSETFIAENTNFIRNIHDLWKPSAPRSSAPAQESEKSALGILEEWIFRQKNPIAYHNLLTEILDEYKKANINDIAQSPYFQTDIDRLRDSIMALAIVPSTPHPHRDRLVNALRICRIIERMADDDEDLKKSYGIEKAMKAPVVLPTDIFPLPPAKKIEDQVRPKQDDEREENLGKLRKKRNALKIAIEEMTRLRPDDYVPPPQPPTVELKKDDIKKLSESTRQILEALDIDISKTAFSEALSRLEAERGKAEEAKTTEIQAAMDELLKVASSHLPKPKAGAIAEQWKPMILKTEAVERLSETTRELIDELGLDLQKDQVPQIINTLEEKLVKVGAKLYKPPVRRRVIQRGTSRFEFRPGMHPYPEPQPFPVPDLQCQVRPVGIGEYNSVRQTLLRYEAGEIAHIENVLRGEYKERVHRRLRRVEEEITYEEERKATTEKDLQSTDRFELKREASETIQEEHKAEAGVTVKYDGPVTVEATAGYTYTHAKEQAKKTAVSYARDVVQKSVSKLEEKVHEERTRKTI